MSDDGEHAEPGPRAMGHGRVVPGRPGTTPAPIAGCRDGPARDERARSGYLGAMTGARPRPAKTERPGATQWVPEGADVARLREAAEACRGCELYRDTTRAVMGDGPEDAPLRVLGEQPGDKEDLAGEPFVGPAGQLLDRALEEAGIPAGSVFRTNVVEHFRFSGTRGKQRINKSPSTWHVAACGPWLAAERPISGSRPPPCEPAVRRRRALRHPPPLTRRRTGQAAPRPKGAGILRVLRY